MSPSYKTTEQYERWHIRDCVRCGHRAAKAANWEGPICRTCYAKALQVRGRCPGCDVDRLLPGRRDDHAPVCRDCAGVTRDFSCDRCGFEGHLHTGRRCTRCTLSDQLRYLLDYGTGRVHPPLVPLAEAVAVAPQPKNGLSWLRSRKSSSCWVTWQPAGYRLPTKRCRNCRTGAQSPTSATCS